MELYISHNIKHLISKENWDQSIFGQQFGISKAVVSHYVTGKNVPKIETLVKICEYFNLTLDQLVRENLSTVTIYVDPATNEFWREPPASYNTKGMNAGDNSLISELKQHLKTKDQLIESQERTINTLEKILDIKGKAAS